MQEKHEQDRARIGTIKQSLLGLKVTQNEELQRIKDEHEASLEAAEEAARTELAEMQASFEAERAQISQSAEDRWQELRDANEELR